jgi:hypothetical protein
MSRTVKANGNNPHDDYDVGYGKAPEQTRFKPGISGNPKGRPRRERDGQLNEMLEQELYRRIRIKQNNLTTSIPALRVSMRNLMMSAVKGDPAAIMAALKIAGNVELEREAKRAKNPPVSIEEKVRRIKALFSLAEARQQRKSDRAQSKQPVQENASR